MSQLKKDVQLTLLSRVPVMFLSFLSVIFLTRLLGPEGNGVYTFTFAALNLFFTVMGFQLEGSLTVFLAKEKANSSAIMSAIGMLAILTTLIFSIALTVVVFVIPGGSEWVLPPDQPVLFFFIFLLIAFSLRRISTLVQASLRGKFKFKSYNFYLLLNQLIPALVYGILLFLTVSQQINLTLLTCFKVILVLELVITLVGLYILWHNQMITFSNQYKPFIEPISNLSFKSLLSASGHFLNKRLDVWFVQFYKGTAMLGQYGLATQIANFVSEAMTPFNQVLIPYIAEASPEQHNDIVTRTARLNMFIATVAALTIISSSWLFIPLLFGKAFEESIPATQILAIGVIFISQRLVFMGYFKAINKMHYAVHAAWAGVLITVILDILLIPKYGILGAAIATTFAYATSSCYLIFVAYINLRFSLASILILKKSDIKWLLSKNKKDIDI
jgi:O-antigen/teichoic acid export membrane protein